MENEHFTGLLVRHQQEIYRYVFAMVPNDADALDIVQDTAVLLIRKSGEFESDRPFVPWACAFARNVALNFIAKRARIAKKREYFSPETIQVIAAERAEYESVLESRRGALLDCLKQLPLSDRQLIESRYNRHTSISDFAKRSGNSRVRLYHRIQKLRKVLSACIDGKIAPEGSR